MLDEVDSTNAEAVRIAPGLSGPEGILASGKKGLSVVDCSTSDPVSTLQLATELRAAGMDLADAKRLKELEKENQRLRRAVSDLTLDKLILAEAAKGNF